MSNVAVTVLTPLFALEDVMYFMPSAPLICCSSGVVTADSTSGNWRPCTRQSRRLAEAARFGNWRDGERGDASRARENNKEGANSGEDRAMNKKVDHRRSG